VIEKKSAFATQKSVIAFQGADSAVERVIKRIYINNSPLISACPLGSNLGVCPATTDADSTLTVLAGKIPGVANVASCTGSGSNQYISGSNNGDPNYSFQIYFLDSSEVPVSCADPAWRDKTVRLKSFGYYRKTSRIIDVGVRPRI
jgi:hypothetical protein